MDFLEFFVLLAFLLCSFPLGYLGGRAYALAMHRLTLALELRIQDIEHRLVKESRRVAGNLSARSRAGDDELLEMAKNIAAKKASSPSQQSPFAWPEI